MRQAPERDDIGDRHRPVEDVALGQVGDPPRALGERHLPERGPVDQNLAARRDEAGDGLEQRRLAGAVRPDDHNDLAAPDDEVGAEEDVPPAEAHVDGAGHDQRRRALLMSRLRQDRSGGA